MVVMETGRVPSASSGVDEESAQVRSGAAALTAQVPRFYSMATAFTLLTQGHTALAVVVGLPGYVPYLLWTARQAVAQGRALVAEARAGPIGSSQPEFQHTVDP